MIDLSETERLETLKLISHILQQFNTSNCLKSILKDDQKFLFFLRCALKSLLIIAQSQFFTLKNKENENIKTENMDKADFFAIKNENDRFIINLFIKTFLD